MNVAAWIDQRPERRVLVYVLGFGAVLSALLALLPRVVAESLLGLALPQTGTGGGGAREALLSRYRIVFLLGALALAAITLAVPRVAHVVDRALSWMTKVDKRAFLFAVLAIVVVSRVGSMGRMLPIVPGQDTGHYWQLANTLLDEGRFIEYASHPNEPDGFRAWRTPGYPFALAGALALTGRHEMTVLGLNVLWMIVLVLAIYSFVRGLATERAARLAALGCAVYPRLLTASMTAMSELQFSALIAVAGALFVVGKGSLKHSILAGVALGLATLTRGNGLVMAAVLTPTYAAVLWWMSGARDGEAMKRAVSRAAVMFLAFALTMSPWTIRNRLVLDTWVPLSTNGGWNMWLGHRPGSTGYGGPAQPGAERAPQIVFSVVPDEVERNKAGMRESLKYWRAEPITNIKTSVRIVGIILKLDQGAIPLLRLENRAAYLTAFAAFNLIYYSMWLLFGVWVITALLGRWPPDQWAGSAFFLGLLYVATYMPFLGWSRYKVPALPFLIAGACIVLAVLVAERRASEEASVATGVLPE